ncbi:MAG: hypothetical protein VCA36_04515, partial [Opitutales bacterium]
TLILTSFVYLTAYINGSDEHWMYDYEMQESVASPRLEANGAKTAFPWLLGVQGFILMFLGTGNVAAGTAEEREAGLLDYQRMTPMNPFSKIVGYVFGLPGREYYMFALTLPFLAHATIVGGLALTKVLHLYVVFLSCVLLYHLTAHVTGLIVRKPRAASWISRLVVLALYVFLPALGQVGFSFLSFLTLLPTYLGIMSKELKLSWQKEQEPEASFTDSTLEAVEEDSTHEPWMDEDPPPLEYSPREEFDPTDFWSEVPFFETTISPSLFTVLMQGLLLAGLIAAAHRKWRNESMPAFSKPFGIGLFALLQLLLLGSLWQFYGDGTASGLLGNFFSQNNYNFEDDETGVVLILVQSVLFTLSLLAAVLILSVTCPTRHQYLKGKRRSAKLGLPDVPFMADEKPGWLVALCLVVLMTLTHYVLLSRAIASELYFQGNPELEVYFLPCLFFAACVVYVRAARERWFTMGFWGFLGLLWITPLLLSMLLAVGGEEDALSAIFHVGSLSPPFAFFEISARAHDLGVEPEEESLRAAAVFGTIAACSIALFLSVTQYRLRRSWDQLENSIAAKEQE